MKIGNSTIKQNKLFILILIVGFVIYNCVLYSQTPFDETPTLSQSALSGAVLYQKHNCTACHQMYGLGGYLGPDLTNAASNGENAEQRIKTFLSLGYKSMPKYDFTDDELENMIQFLIEVDETGYYPDCVDEIESNGWVNIRTKHTHEAK